MSLIPTSRRRFLSALGLAGVTVGTAGVAVAHDDENERENEREHEQENEREVEKHEETVRDFRAELAGENEVPPVNTDAEGRADFKLDSDEDILKFDLKVDDIVDVVAAHIHLAPVGVNGPVSVTLFDGPTTSEDGRLARGEIRPADVNIVDFDGLLAEMRAGDTYVNVHTTANPSGEIRGQIVPRD